MVLSNILVGLRFFPRPRHALRRRQAAGAAKSTPPNPKTQIHNQLVRQWPGPAWLRFGTAAEQGQDGRQASYRSNEPDAKLNGDQDPRSEDSKPSRVDSKQPDGGHFCEHDGGAECAQDLRVTRRFDVTRVLYSLISLVTSSSTERMGLEFKPAVEIQIGNIYRRRAASLSMHCENKMVSLVF
jgi:hypothetical protein